MGEWLSLKVVQLSTGYLEKDLATSSRSLEGYFVLSEYHGQPARLRTTMLQLLEMFSAAVGALVGVNVRQLVLLLQARRDDNNGPVRKCLIKSRGARRVGGNVAAGVGVMGKYGAAASQGEGGKPYEMTSSLCLAYVPGMRRFIGDNPDSELFTRSGRVTEGGPSGNQINRLENYKNGGILGGIASEGNPKARAKDVRTSYDNKPHPNVRGFTTDWSHSLRLDVVRRNKRAVYHFVILSMAIYFVVEPHYLFYSSSNCWLKSSTRHI
ncbi:hypothetical protein J6590_016087 [Homalodisca vitripennis]|nr:hypothetical protein J6590_016087 [Homalodisca vitripennis]